MGCGNRTKIQYETKLIVPDDTLIKACDKTPPPSKEDMVNADDVQRQRLYADAWHDTFEDLVECDTRMGAIREWKERQLQAEQELEDED